MVVPASSSYRVPPSFLQIPIPLRQRSPPHRHLLMSFLQQSSDPSTVHSTVQHPNKTLLRGHHPKSNSFKPLKNTVLICNPKHKNIWLTTCTPKPEKNYWLLRALVCFLCLWLASRIQHFLRALPYPTPIMINAFCKHLLYSILSIHLMMAP